MKKRFLISIFLIISMLMVVLLYTINRESTIDNHQYETSKIIMGEIVEIINSKEVKMKITKERGGHRKGDIVIIGYDTLSVELLAEDNELNKDNSEEYQIISVGDIVSVKINSNVEIKEGVDYYSVSEIVKMVY